MEIESLKDDYIGNKPLLKYLRYNFPISENDLIGFNVGEIFTEKNVESLVEMSNTENREILYKIVVAASGSVKKSHFE